MEERAHAVDDAGVVAGEQLEREERRAAARGALVLEPAPQELRLLPEAHLTDRAVGDRALPEVLRARRGLELLIHGGTELRELPLVGELGGPGRDLGEAHAAYTEASGREAGPT